MKSFSRLALIGLCLLLSQGLFADDRAELHTLLDDFLAFNTSNAWAKHQRFWAEDLVYTSSSGTRFGKAQIMAGLSPGTDQPTDQSPVTDSYRAEEVDIRLLGTTAIVAFRLIREQSKDGKTEISEYLNTGTFVKRKGQWRALAWQATVAADD